MPSSAIQIVHERIHSVDKFRRIADGYEPAPFVELFSRPIEIRCDHRRTQRHRLQYNKERVSSGSGIPVPTRRRSMDPDWAPSPKN